MNTGATGSPTSARRVFVIDPADADRPLDAYDAPSLMADQGDLRFHVMVKPTGSTCNLDCSYCFYLSTETLPGGPGPGRMSDDTLEHLVRQYTDGVTAEEVVFSWRGGEPALRGLDFYRRAVELQKRHARPGQRIENDSGAGAGEATSRGLATVDVSRARNAGHAVSPSRRRPSRSTTGSSAGTCPRWCSCA